MKTSLIGVALTMIVSVCHGAPIVNDRVKDLGNGLSQPKSVLQSIFDTISSMAIYKSKSINTGPCNGKCHGNKRFRCKDNHLKHPSEELHEYHHEVASANLL